MAGGLTLPRGLRNWFLTAVVCFFGSMLLGEFQTTTQLLPDHERVSSLCVYTPCVLAFLSACLVFWKARGFPWWACTAWALLAMLLSALASFSLMNYTADLIEGWLDFPAGQTKTFPAQLAISRAYIMTGKGRSWHIQTMPVWTDLNISKTDYDWMLAHRRPSDSATREEKISSRGYYCAAVTLQQAGGAFRILHAGSQTLPVGTVRLCPTASE